MEGMSWKVLLLLLGSVVCSAFAGLQSIVVLEWLQPLLLLQFIHHAKVLERKLSSIIGLLVLILVSQTLGFTIAYAAELNDSLYTLTGLLTVAGVSALCWFLLTFVFTTAARYEQRFPEAYLAHSFAFPVVWMTIWHAAASFSPIGAVGSPAYSVVGIRPLVLTVSLWGIDGLVFLMAWTASLMHNRLQLRQEAAQRSSAVSGGAALVEEIEEGFSNYYGATASSRSQTTKEFASKVKRHDSVVKIWVGFLIFSLLYAGVTEVFLSGTFFEKGITETIKPTVGASCILRQPSELASVEVEDSEFLWNATTERVRAGDAFIVWSETATVVYGQQGEDNLLSRARQVLALEQEKMGLELKLKSSGDKGPNAVQHGPYLGLSYAMVVDGKKVLSPKSQYNVFTFMLPDGSVGFRYEKTNPVPFVEAETIPGPGELKFVKTPLGTVGAAICFDYQFPRLLDQAAYNGADIMIQPSWTWGPMANFEFKANAYRAVEQGFTLLRCSSTGQSGVVTAHNEFIDLRESTSTSVVTMQLPITPKVFTLYPWGGFIFSVFIEIVAAKYIFMAWLPLSWVLAVSNFFPGVVNTFFVGDKFEEDVIGKKTYRRYMTRTRNSSKWEVAKRPFYSRSQSII